MPRTFENTSEAVQYLIHNTDQRSIEIVRIAQQWLSTFSETITVNQLTLLNPLVSFSPCD
jgi:hypothetical protein